MKLRNMMAFVAAITVAATASITGKVDLSGAGVVNARGVAVAFQDKTYPVATDGSYTIPSPDVGVRAKAAMRLQNTNVVAYDITGRKIKLTGIWSSELPAFKVQTTQANTLAARSLALNDTLYIVVNGDTLREVPVTSWDTILPPNYIVQRNVGVTVDASNYTNKVQVVWWNTDSIAHVLDLGHASTDPSKFSGYIYTVYNDADFRNDAHLYNLFVRTRTSDSIKSYTQVLDVKARVGDLVFSPADFKTNTFHTTAGYSLTPNDSSVAVYNLTKNISMVYVTIEDTLDSIALFDSTTAGVFTFHKDSTLEFPNGYVEIVWPKLNLAAEFHTVNDTFIVRAMYNINVQGAVTSDIDTLKVEYGRPQSWIVNDSAVNLKAGDSFAMYLNAGTETLTSAKVSDLKVRVTWSVSKSYWR